MTQTETCSAKMYFMSPAGELLQHACRLDAGHFGNHVCGCLAQWPRRDIQYADWHSSH